MVESEPLTEFTFLDTVRFPEAVRVRIVDERIALLRRTPLSLRTGPLSRIALLRTAPSRYRLELIVHHIVCDGWSLALLWQDFLDAYRRVAAGEPGPGPSPYRFRDHVRWERRTESARWLKRRPTGSPAASPTGRRSCRCPSLRLPSTSTTTETTFRCHFKRGWARRSPERVPRVVTPD